MKSFFAFTFALAGLSLFALPTAQDITGFDVLSLPWHARLAGAFCSWFLAVAGLVLSPSAAFLAGFLVLTALGAHTPDHESLAAAIRFLGGLLCVPAAWFFRDEA